MPQLARRRLLQIGGLGAFGLHLPRLLAAEASADAAGAPRAIRSCILVFFYGGPSHLDTLDMKPDAPAEVRGEFQPIASSVPGLQVSEHLPLLARQMHHAALLRGMHHPMRNHNSAAAEALTGRTPAGGDLELLADEARSFPNLGSSLSYLWRNQNLRLSHVALPHVMQNVVTLPGQTAGFLGPRYERFQIEADPTAPNFKVPSLETPADVPTARLSGRRSLLGAVDGGPDDRGSSVDGAMRTQYEKAFSLLDSEEVRRGMDLSREADATRDRYGRTRLGQSVLLARRLVESGVRFVSVFDGIANGQDANWDSHQLVFVRSRDHLLPPADRALAALLADLEERALLDETLVVAMGEFGRTPRINAGAGRDHWPDCYTVLLAGGGVRGGYVHGASDRLGAYPDRDGVTPGDLAATLFARFGINPHAEIRDPLGRPFAAADGRPIDGLFA